tara:strand:+ start:261 stop:530 length:270 start_codon:yes stop_codon:yes gene_type:complete
MELKFIDDSEHHEGPTRALQRDGRILVGYVWELVPDSLYEFEYQAPDDEPIVDIAGSWEEAETRLAALASELEDREHADAPRGWGHVTA